MLEVNIYDNFNPNELNILDFPLPDGSGSVARPIPKPKARTQVLEYELWQTGYKYTSSATFASEIEVGDIVEVLTIENVPMATTPDITEDYPLSLIYLVTDVDENNRATLKNYFWAMIEGNEIPTKMLKSTTRGILIRMIDPNINQLMTYDFMYNGELFKQGIKYNRKSDTTDVPSVAKDMFSAVNFQPFPTIRRVEYDPDGEVLVPRDTIEMNMTSRTWVRSAIETRIDEALKPSVEYETIVTRSNYNYIVVYVKTTPDGDTYGETPQIYTMDDNGNLVNVRNYKGDGHDLPEQRIMKTLFYDEQPSNAQLKFEVSPDTVIANLFFNQDPKRELYVNDLARIYYNGRKYEGYIADRVFTPANDRLLFVEARF
ncbi:tail associated lysin [Lactococcus phage PLgW-1]|uniref:Tail associated lysin n=1 Tax=Lactococcus phage PLgW-1 TaxID=1983536 RepID=A0A2Z2GTJ3_9CAUD|nr:tail associated lysin [Lactococcus phage PLgW-1]ARQ94831.1 tail associated lysin [Lactococcus phage PLgW-1]